MKFKLNSIKLFLFFSFCAISAVLFSFGAKASSSISITGLESPITSENLAPGDSVLKNFSVIKKDDNDQILMINFSETMGNWITGSNDLKSRIQVKIKDEASGKFLKFPNNLETESLENLYKLGSFKFDSIAGPNGSKFDYQLQFIFDPLAGNEYQNKKTVFDISVGIDSIETEDDNGEEDDDDDDDGDNDGNDPVIASFISAGITSNIPLPPAITPESDQTQKDVEGEETIQDDDQDIAGDSAMICNPFPKLWFILALLAYILILYISFFKINFKEKLKVKLLSYIVFSIAAIVFWWHFDYCRTNIWFAYSAPISGFILYSFNLKLKKQSTS